MKVSVAVLSLLLLAPSGASALLSPSAPLAPFEVDIGLHMYGGIAQAAKAGVDEFAELVAGDLIRANSRLFSLQTELVSRIDGVDYDASGQLAALETGARVIDAAKTPRGVTTALEGLVTARDIAAAATPIGASLPFPMVDHADLETAFAALLVDYDRELTAEERESVSAFATLPAATREGIRILVDAHLYQRQVTRVALGEAPYANVDIDTLAALRPVLAQAVADALPLLKAVEGTKQLASSGVTVVCPVFMIDVNRVDSVYDGPKYGASFGCDAGLIVDLGGNDIYRNNAGGASVPFDFVWNNLVPGQSILPAAMMVDIGGDDIITGYSTSTNAIAGSGYVGSGALFLIDGWDIITPSLFSAGGATSYRAYSTASSNHGSGFFFNYGGENQWLDGTARERSNAMTNLGHALIVSANARDRYQGGNALAFGTGSAIIVDEFGDDDYYPTGDSGNAASWGSLAVSVAATPLLSPLALIVDVFGNDHYGRSTTIGIAQMNAIAESGVAILYDDSGTNRFETPPSHPSIREISGGNARAAASYTKLGVANADRPYPGGVALLVSGRDDDFFIGYGQSNGVALSRSFASLIDLGGTDVYVSYVDLVSSRDQLGLAAARDHGVALLSDVGRHHGGEIFGETAAIVLGDDVTGQGSGEQALAMITQRNPTGHTVYKSGVTSRGSYVSGDGLSIRDHEGSIIFHTGFPYIGCRDSPTWTAQGASLVKRYDLWICRRAESTRHDIQDPVTGEAVGDVFKPGVGCGGVCWLVINLFGTDAPGWLAEPRMSASTSGGLKHINGLNLEMVEYTRVEADNVCRLGCAGAVGSWVDWANG